MRAAGDEPPSCRLLVQPAQAGRDGAGPGPASSQPMPSPTAGTTALHQVGERPSRCCLHTGRMPHQHRPQRRCPASRGSHAQRERSHRRDLPDALAAGDEPVAWRRHRASIKCWLHSFVAATTARPKSCSRAPVKQACRLATGPCSVADRRQYAR